MKKLALIITLALSVQTVSARDYQQQQDIKELIKEVQYQKSVAIKLKQKYQNDKSKIRFNYDALIRQLDATIAGMNEYIQQEVYEIHDEPPKAVKPNTVKVKP